MFDHKDLGQDADGNFFGRFSAEIKPDRGAQSTQFFFIDAAVAQGLGKNKDLTPAGEQAEVTQRLVDAVIKRLLILAIGRDEDKILRLQLDLLAGEGKAFFRDELRSGGELSGIETSSKGIGNRQGEAEWGGRLGDGAIDMPGAKQDEVPALLEGYIFPTLEEQAGEALLGGGTVKAVADTSAFLLEQGKIPAALSDYKPYVSTRWVSDASKLAY